MSYFYRALLSIGFLIWIGCSDETTIYQDSLRDDVRLEENSVTLKAVVQYGNSGVIRIFEDDPLTGKAAELAGDYPLTLIATLDPPSDDSGTPLTASHVDLQGDFVFVGYNTAGEDYYGAVDVVDVSDPHNPIVSSRLVYPNADINAVSYQEGFLYAVGGMDQYSSLQATSSSFIARIPVSAGILSTEVILYGFQPGDNSTDVLVETDRVLVSSGTLGSITAFSKADLSILAEVYVEDARAMTAMGSGIGVLDAGNGVRLLSENLNETGMIPIETYLGSASKKTLDVWLDKIAVAEAAEGAGIYSPSAGGLLEYLPIPIHPEGVESGDIVTNAVTANEEMLFMANGGAGLSLSRQTTDGIQLVGIIELSGSVNYVVSREDYAFAASGSTGLQIIKLNRASESLETRCADLPLYEGSSKLNVHEGEIVAYRGEKRFNNLNIDGALLLCGSWTVANHVDVKDNASFELYGTLAIGRNDQRRNLKVGVGGILRIEGDVTIYGDLILEQGSRVEFLGSDSEIDIFGSVKYLGESTVLGTFRDVRNKF